MYNRKFNISVKVNMIIVKIKVSDNQSKLLLQVTWLEAEEHISEFEDFSLFGKLIPIHLQTQGKSTTIILGLVMSIILSHTQ